MEPTPLKQRGSRFLLAHKGNELRFSERYGYRKVRDLIQLESMDESLRNGLWSVLQLAAWDYIQVSDDLYNRCYLSSHHNRELHTLCKRMWMNHFKYLLDRLDEDWSEVYPQVRKHFFECEWYDVYDFIEFVANNYDRYGFKEEIISACNRLLEREVSAYRFVGGIITQVTEVQEVEAIEGALGQSSGPVRSHLQRALELMSDRQVPDYRNSIKESISAVESFVTLAVGERGTLGQLIKRLESRAQIHPALRSAFSSLLYGYASDEGGIRHALLESESVCFEDAKFFLVACSAFIIFCGAKLG